MGPSEAPSKAELHLLLSNRMWSNSAKQWLPANGCAHAALFHKDTLGPVCFEILAIIYVAHAITWQLLEGHIDKHC